MRAFALLSSGFVLTSNAATLSKFDPVDPKTLTADHPSGFTGASTSEESFEVDDLAVPLNAEDAAALQKNKHGNDVNTRVGLFEDKKKLLELIIKTFEQFETKVREESAKSKETFMKVEAELVELQATYKEKYDQATKEHEEAVETMKSLDEEKAALDAAAQDAATSADDTIENTIKFFSISQSPNLCKLGKCEVHKQRAISHKDKIRTMFTQEDTSAWAETHRVAHETQTVIKATKEEEQKFFTERAETLKKQMKSNIDEFDLTQEQREETLKFMKKVKDLFADVQLQGNYNYDYEGHKKFDAAAHSAALMNQNHDAKVKQYFDDLSLQKQQR